MPGLAILILSTNILPTYLLDVFMGGGVMPDVGVVLLEGGWTIRASYAWHAATTTCQEMVGGRVGGGTKGSGGWRRARRQGKFISGGRQHTHVAR